MVATYPIRSPTVYQVAQFAGPTTGALAAQRALILATQDSAGWLIAKSIIIVIAEVAAIVLIIGINHKTPAKNKTYRRDPGNTQMLFSSYSFRYVYLFAI